MGRSVRSAARWPGAVLAVLCVALTLPAAAQDGALAPSKAELETRVTDLRARLETAYLDVASDHARVRAKGFAVSVSEVRFKTALDSLVGSAKGLSPEETGQLVDLLVGQMTYRGPLSKRSLRLVLRDVASRASGAVSASALFVNAARKLFEPDSPADVWDASFQDVAVVRDWRTATAALAAAERAAGAAAGNADGDTDGNGTPGTPDRSGGKVGNGSVTPPPEAATPLDHTPVLFERGRGFVGPWEGWTAELSEKENKRQRRSFKTIYADPYEVTCAQYQAFMNGQDANERPVLLPDGWELGADGAARHPSGKGRHPVTGVSFEQARAYAAAQGKRLPTEDEWELIAAGGKAPRRFPWGDTDEGRSWIHGDSKGGTAAVDAAPDDVTGDGVFGMAGNVAELVATLPNRKDAPKGRLQKGQRVVTRGGSYKSRSSECVTSFRWVADAEKGAPHVGFRCVMDEAEYRRRHGR